jgi:hypothetical protein
MAEAQAHFPRMGGQALSNVAWALCRMDLRPPDFWIEDYLLWCRAAWRREAFSKVREGVCWWRTLGGATSSDRPRFVETLYACLFCGLV